MTGERGLQNEILLATHGTPLTLWRNNTGMGWTGDVTRLPDGSLLIRNPRPLHAGLCKGSSDLIGLRQIELGGQQIAQFVAVEVKAKRGRVSPEQRRFLDFVRAAGGLGTVARSAEDLPT